MDSSMSLVMATGVLFYLFTSTDFALTHADPIHRVNKNSLWR